MEDAVPRQDEERLTGVFSGGLWSWQRSHATVRLYLCSGCRDNLHRMT